MSDDDAAPRARRARTLAAHVALVAFGTMLGLAVLEVTLRLTAQAFLYRRQQVGTPSGLPRSEFYRVLCLGESTTADMAWSPAQGYPAQLEKIINARGTGLMFKVINGGVPATTTDKSLEGLDADLDRHRPQIVVTPRPRAFTGSTATWWTTTRTRRQPGTTAS
jgi:hypothetical protein